MPRLALAVLATAGATWALLGIAAIGLSSPAAGWLTDRVPELTIGAAAVGGAAAALGVACIGLGLAHLAVVAAGRRGLRWAVTAGTLLSATLAMVTGASAIAAAVSATTVAGLGPLLVLGAVVLGLASVLYLLSAAQLVRARGPI